jgi:hypothetical protein
MLGEDPSWMCRDVGHVVYPCGGVGDTVADKILDIRKRK